MSKFYMTDAELIYEYKTAKNKQKQIRIFADLNLTTVREVKEKLYGLGLLDKPPKKTAPTEPLRTWKTKAQKSREWRVGKKAAGLCQRCGTRASAEGVTLCDACRKKRNIQRAGAPRSAGGKASERGRKA